MPEITIFPHDNCNFRAWARKHHFSGANIIIFRDQKLKLSGPKIEMFKLKPENYNFWVRFVLLDPENYNFQGHKFQFSYTGTCYFRARTRKKKNRARIAIFGSKIIIFRPGQDHLRVIL